MANSTMAAKARAIIAPITKMRWRSAAAIATNALKISGSITHYHRSVEKEVFGALPRHDWIQAEVYFLQLQKLHLQPFYCNLADMQAGSSCINNKRPHCECSKPMNRDRSFAAGAF